MQVSRSTVSTSNVQSSKPAASSALPKAAPSAAETPAVAPQDQALLAAQMGKASPALALEPEVHPGIEALKELKPKELAALGKQKDKTPFFKALLPAALESQRKYGIPAQLTLAQAALESGWGKHAIGGYNIFGIKGSGPAGSVVQSTREYTKTHIKAAFAKFHNFYEAVSEHGQLFHNGSYDKAIAQYQKNGNIAGFVKNIAPVYATAPNYDRTLLGMIKHHDLDALVQEHSPVS